MPSLADGLFALVSRRGAIISRWTFCLRCSDIACRRSLDKACNRVTILSRWGLNQRERGLDQSPVVKFMGDLLGLTDAVPVDVVGDLLGLAVAVPVNVVGD